MDRKKNNYKTMRELGYHPLKNIFNAKTHFKKIKDEEHSLKYRGHRYDRKHKRV